MGSKFSLQSTGFRMQLFIYCAAIVVYCMFAPGCAQVVTPDGGPKDRTPPHVVKYTPDSAATNFHGKKIVITFDEYIALNDLNKQLIISPAVKRRPEISIRRKDLIIEFKDSLDANTTYSISFGKSIRDITENNVLNNFRFVFSTGPVIDSLTYSGTVVNAQTLRGERNVLVMLYRNTGDSVPYKEKPYYYTRTDDNGNFLLTNLAAATYKLFALDDEGQDYLFNSSEERIAFSDSLIRLNADVDSVRMVMFRQQSTKQFLVNAAQMSAGRFQFIYNLPVTAPVVSTYPKVPLAMTPAVEANASGDTIEIWLPAIEIDSVNFVVASENTVLDTIPMKLLKPGNKKPVRAGVTDKRALILKHNGSTGKLLPGNQFTIFASNPLRKIDTSKIMFRIGSGPVDGKIMLNKTGREIHFQVPFPEDSSFSVFIPPGALIDIFGQKNDTLKANFVVQPTRQFGNLSIRMPNLAAGKYLVEVMDDKDHVVRDTSIAGPANIHFSVMNAGSYRVRVIYDEDGNGKWTPGNYPMKKQPEKVLYYALPVKIRAGWDMDIEWLLH